MRKRLLKYVSPLGILLLGGSVIAMPMPMQMGTNNSATSYSTRGVVEKIAPGQSQATIDTDEIPGYMAKMTMDYPVEDTNQLNGISPGDIVTFTLVVTKNSDWIKDIHQTGQTGPATTNAMSSMSSMDPELKAGDPLPDGVLITEEGRQIHFSDFHGQAIAFTFFYTRCPLPNYCPLMNRNFAAARDIISSTTSAPTNWEFLSISFDPENDTPQVLTTYGDFYRNDNSSHWLFASAPTNTLATLAPALDLMVFREGTGISHNLRTVVLDPRGRIYRQFDGNQWTPKDLADAVLTAAKQ
jgi:protein SCO1/2